MLCLQGHPVWGELLRVGRVCAHTDLGSGGEKYLQLSDSPSLLRYPEGLYRRIPIYTAIKSREGGGDNPMVGFLQARKSRQAPALDCWKSQGLLHQPQHRREENGAELPARGGFFLAAGNLLQPKFFFLEGWNDLSTSLASC